MKKIMRKWALLITVVVAVTGCAVAAALSAQTTDFVLMINNQFVETEKPVVAIDNSSYLPVRELSEKLGFNVTWLEKLSGMKKIIYIQTNLMGEIQDEVKNRIKLDLPDNVKLLDYFYDGEWSSFVAKISVPHEEIGQMLEQLEKEYGKESETIKDAPWLEKTISKEYIVNEVLHYPMEPSLIKNVHWWDLDKEQIEYAYYKIMTGGYNTKAWRRTQIDMLVFILKEVEGQHLVYIVY